VLELQTQLLLSIQLGFGDPVDVQSDVDKTEEVARILNALLNSSGTLPPRKPFK